MSRLPIVNFKTIDKLLKTIGFEPVRQKGSHVFDRHPDGRTTTAPNHKGRDLARALLREILKDIELSVNEFLNLIDNKSRNRN